MIFEKKIKVALVNPNGLFTSASPATGFSLSGTEVKEVAYTMDVVKAIKDGILKKVTE
ncbi:MAG: hypothetical protein JWN78_392 [Bacteroidota bacterium]|nr:hypothetical protein [Bacteroidota bacterium]